jgi:NAD(P) transhydrogenase
VRAEHVLIACGTRPARPDDIPFDERILDPDGIVGAVGGELPHSALVVGAGIIGLEYASMLAALDIAVTVIDARDELLPFADRDVLAGFERHMTASGARFYLSRKLVRVARQGSGVEAQLDKGERLRADLLLYAVGRQPNTDRLDLAAAGVPVDACGRVAVDAEFRTAVRHICAAGDVIGFPALASTSMEQGRLAACYLFGAPARHAPALLPYGIYTIPEMAMVGRTEEQLRAEGTAYAVGIARFEELAKAQIIGDSTGLLKLLFCPDSHQLLGVHALGDGVSELLHIGQSVLALGGTVEFLRDNVFNYPTLAEAYRVAAIDGLNRLGRPRRPVV